MNSLAYLSRQFDALAAAKTPPSTPTSERPSPTDRHRRNTDSNSPLQRTWSAKSFLFSPSPSGSAPKRSSSSPSFAALHNLQLTPVTASTQNPSTSLVLEAQPRSKSSFDNVIRRIFFIRAFVMVWDNLRAAWLSLWRMIALPKPPHRADKFPDHPVMVDRTDVQSTTIVVEESVETIELAPESSPSPKGSLTTIHQPLPAAHISESPASTSRSSTPVLPAKKTPFHQQKTLVLDLDETLIHSTSKPIYSLSGSRSGLLGLGFFNGRNKNPSHMVEVVLGGRSTLYHVYKRPFVDFFLRTVSGWYTLVIFTASMQEYADPVIDWLDAGRGILCHRLFRDSCTQLPNGSYTKDLSLVESDLSRVCLIDNSPISYRVNEANGIPIEGWTNDPSDEALLDLLPVLDSLRFTSDVRRVLGLRSAGISS